MPEYLAPGVYVEETSFRARSIEGVSTSTTAFVGPTRKGPVEGPPVFVSSFGEFERIFGGFGDLDFGGGPVTNHLAHGVQAYFNNGGARLYVARVFATTAGDPPDGPEVAQVDFDRARGLASSDALGGGDATGQIRFVARSPGALGNGRVEVALRTVPATERARERAPRGSLLRREGDPPQFFVNGPGGFLNDADPPAAPGAYQDGDVLVTVDLLYRDAEGEEYAYQDLGLAPGHPRYIGDVLAREPDRLVDRLELPVALLLGDAVEPPRLYAMLEGLTAIPLSLSGGRDGNEPTAAAYADPLAELARVDEISIVAAPGYGALGDRQAIQEALVGHAETRKAYRIAVLETRPGILPQEALDDRAVVDSSHAAMYYPWVVVSNPLARPDDASIPRELHLPPSSFVCGIFARNDIARSVAKSPGNEVVRGALRFERNIGHAEQELLNPRGVNCLRFFPGRGHRLWGARTASSDPEWKYVGPRRYFLYLEHSIDRSTQWAVFENNGPRLWADVTEAVSSFLYNEWRSGNLLGATPEQAYFVRCDRSTMTQNDLDNGRLICLIGVAVLKPAEFVVFRIGQKTAEARD